MEKLEFWNKMYRGTREYRDNQSQDHKEQRDAQLATGEIHTLFFPSSETASGCLLSAMVLS